jgi:hypothetical protein
LLAVEQLIAAGAGLDVKTNCGGYEPINPAALAVRYLGRQPIRWQGHCAHLGREGGSHGRGQAAHCRRRRPRCQAQQWVRANIPEFNGCAISEPAADSSAGSLRSSGPRGRVTCSRSSSSFPPAPASISRATMGTSQYTRVRWLCDIRAGSRFVGRDTALILTAAKGHTLVVKQLIAAGAGLDVKEQIHGYGPIYSIATAVRYPSRQPTFSEGALRSCWPRTRVTHSWSSSSFPPAPASISRRTMGTSQYTRLQWLSDVRAGGRLSRQGHGAHQRRSRGAHRHHSRSHLRRRRCRCVEQRRVRHAPTRLHECGRASARAHFTRAGRLRRPSPKSKASRWSMLRQCVRCGEWSILGRP